MTRFERNITTALVAVLLLASAILMCGDCEDLTSFLFVKAVAFALGATGVLIARTIKTPAEK